MRGVPREFAHDRCCLAAIRFQVNRHTRIACTYAHMHIYPWNSCLVGSSVRQKPGVSGWGSAVRKPRLPGEQATSSNRTVDHDTRYKPDEHRQNIRQTTVKQNSSIKQYSTNKQTSPGLPGGRARAPPGGEAALAAAEDQRPRGARGRGRGELLY